MSLPDAWVDRIFEKLTLVYGHQFLSRWDGIPIADVKANWAEELSRFQQNPSALAYALDNLPAGKAPTVLEFRVLCNSPQAPRPEKPLALPAIASPISNGDRHLERLRRVRQQNPDCGRYAWAYALQLKDQEEPQEVTPTVRAMYQDALAIHRRMGGGAIA